MSGEDSYGFFTRDECLCEFGESDGAGGSGLMGEENDHPSDHRRVKGGPKWSKYGEVECSLFPISKRKTDVCEDHF